MKKHKGRLLGGFLALFFLLSGCARVFDGGFNVKAGIQKPSNDQPPMEGTWTISEIDTVSAETSNKEPLFAKGDALYLTADFVGIKGVYTVNPSISSKYVQAKAYLQARFLGQDVTLRGFSDESIEVVMVRDSGSFSIDFMRITEDTCAFSYENNLYYAHRTSKEIPEEVRENYGRLSQEKSPSPADVEENRNRSLLIGVRLKNYDEDNLPIYQYQTYLIREEALGRRPRVYAMNDLLVPRSNQTFTILRYQVLDTNALYGAVSGEFQAYPSTVDPQENKNRLTDNAHRSITYLHGDRVSFEKREMEVAEDSTDRKYEIYPLDQLDAGKPYTVEQLTGKEGQEAYREQMQSQGQRMMANMSHAEAATVNALDYTNIGIERRQLDWSFYSVPSVSVDGRVYARGAYLDLIQIVPVVESPPLAIPWAQVQNKTMRARAAFSTPEKERLLIETDGELQYYRLHGGAIDTAMLLSIQVPSNARIVMMETVYDAGASLWEDELKRHTQIIPQVLYGQAFEDTPAELSDY